MDTSFSEILKTSGSILVLLPGNPNFDTVSAGLALYLSLNGSENKNWDVKISCPTSMTVGFNRIIGVQKISSELGNKNLLIKFKNYDAKNIEKVSYDIINNEFNLTIVPKVGFVAPNNSQIDMNYSGVSASVVVLIGGTSDADFPAISGSELNNAKIIHVGNRNLSSNLGILSFAKNGSTVSEVIANLIKENTLNMDPDVATNLAMGIEEGTGKFSSGDVSAETFEVFAWLLRNGGQRQSRIKISPMGFPPGSIPNQPFNIPQQFPVATPPLQNQPMPQYQPAQPNSVPSLSQYAVSQPYETLAKDYNSTNESESDINPPDDWLQPKVYKSSTMNPPGNPSENLG
jgi:hypothetical protein